MDELARRDSGGFAFGFFPEAVPEHFIQLLLTHALLRHGSTGIADGIFSAVLSPTLTVLELSEPRSVAMLSGRMLELVRPEMCHGLRSISINFSLISGAAAAPWVPTRAASTSSSGGATVSGHTALLTQSELLAFVKVALQGSRGVLEQLQLTGCTCLDAAFFRDLGPRGASAGRRAPWNGDDGGNGGIDGGGGGGGSSSSSSSSSSSTHDDGHGCEGGAGSSGNNEGGGGGTKVPPPLAAVRLPSRESGGARRSALALEACDLADDVGSAALLDAFRSLRHLEGLSLRGCGNRTAVAAPALNPFQHPHHQQSQHHPNQLHAHPEQNPLGGVAHGSGALGSDSQLAEILTVLLPAANDTLEALDISETDAGRETMTVLMGPHASYCPSAAPHVFAATSTVSNANEADSEEAIAGHERARTDRVHALLLPAPYLRHLALDGCPGVDGAFLRRLVLGSPRGATLEGLSLGIWETNKPPDGGTQQTSGDGVGRRGGPRPGKNGSGSPANPANRRLKASDGECASVGRLLVAVSRAAEGGRFSARRCCAASSRSRSTAR